MKKFTIVIIIFIGFLSRAQNTPTQVTKDAYSYMIMNGEKLSSKIDWETFNQYSWVKELYKKSQFKNWSDLSQTGIDYNNFQNYTGLKNDSINANLAELPIKDLSTFENFLQTSPIKGQQIVENAYYKTASMGDDTFIAWNDKKCLILQGYYIQNFLENDVEYENDDYDEIVTDTIEVEVDSATAIVDTLQYPSDVDLANKFTKKFDYKKEIENLEDEKSGIDDELIYIKESLKELDIEKIEYENRLKEINESIEYLKKHKQLPYKPEKELLEKEKENENTTEEENPEEKSPVPSEELANTDKPYSSEEMEENYIELNTIDSLSFIATQKYAKTIFDDAFGVDGAEKIPLKTLKTFPNVNVQEVDILIGYNKDEFFKSLIGSMPYGFPSFYNFYINKGEDSYDYITLNFDDKNIRMTMQQSYNHPEEIESLSHLKSNGFSNKLLKFVDHNSLLYYGLNTKSDKYIDFFYAMLYGNLQDAEKKDSLKFADFYLKNLKTLLDEKAISKIATGQLIFSLLPFHPKEIEYIKYEYDDDFNLIDTPSQKLINSPNFVMAFSTKDEDYWKSLLQTISTTLPKNVLVEIDTNGIYTFTFDKENYLDTLYCLVSNNTVVVTTSLHSLNIALGKERNKDSQKKLKQMAKNHLSFGYVDTKDLFLNLKNNLEIDSETQKDSMFQNMVNNLGDMEFISDTKNGQVITEFKYNINLIHENSVMYFFNLYEELYLYESQKSSL